MLDGGLDATYREVLGGPHEAVVRVEVWGQGARLEGWELDPEDESIPVLGGSVSCSLSNRVTRNLNLTLHEDWYPWEDDDLFAPNGNEIRAYRGVRYGNGEEIVFPAFRGKIQDADMATGGTVEITAADRAQDVVDAAFVRPYPSSAGVNAGRQFLELVLDAVPDAEFGRCDDYWQVMPTLTWETDRGGALDDLGTMLGSYWYALADGRFVLRRVPWTVAGTPVVTLSDEEGGVIHEALPRRTRDGVYNSATAVGERTDGSPPVYGTAEDGNPASPTFVGGKYGRKHKLLRVQAAANQQAAQGAAAAYVRKARSLTQSWSWTQVPDAAMELGEVVGLRARGRSGIVQVVSSFNLPLDLNQQMSVTARAMIVGADADE